MRHAALVRAELGTRTIFNLLGPLANPAGVKYQVLGVFAKAWLEPLARVLRNLGSKRVWLVHGFDGLDEATTTGPPSSPRSIVGEIRSFEILPKMPVLPARHLQNSLEVIQPPMRRRFKVCLAAKRMPIATLQS